MKIKLVLFFLFTVTTIFNERQCLIKIYKGFAYYKHIMMKSGMRWRCTNCTASNEAKCRASIVLDEQNNVIKAYEEHNHEKPQYRRLSNGTYYRMA